MIPQLVSPARTCVSGRTCVSARPISISLLGPQGCLGGPACPPVLFQASLLRPQGHRGRRSPPVPPALGLAPQTPNLMWPPCSTFVCHASVMFTAGSVRYRYRQCVWLSGEANVSRSMPAFMHNGGMTTRYTFDTGVLCRMGLGNRLGSPAGRVPTEWVGQSALQKIYNTSNGARGRSASKNTYTIGLPMIE